MMFGFVVAGGVTPDSAARRAGIRHGYPSARHGGRILVLLSGGRMIRATLILSVVGGVAVLSAQASAPAVEVASVKVNKSGEIGARFRPQPDGSITAVNMPLRGLIEFAYQLPAHRVVGISESAGNIRYDVAARPAAVSTPSAAGSTPSAAGWRPAALMRSMLEERFRLKVHRETQEAPIYELQVSQPGRALGPKLTRSDRDCRPGATA